jgi:hypothetical protein
MALKIAINIAGRGEFDGLNSVEDINTIVIIEKSEEK